MPRELVDETSSMTEMTASSQQNKIGADSTIVTVKEVDKQLQSTEVEGAEEKERKEREEYEELLLDQHNRRVSLERSPTRISQGRPSEGKVTDTQKPEKTDAQEQRGIITNTMVSSCGIQGNSAEKKESTNGRVESLKLRTNRSSSVGDLQSWIVKGGGNNTERTGKRNLETRDKDYNPRESLTELIHMIASEVKKLHSIVSRSLKSSWKSENAARS